MIIVMTTEVSKSSARMPTHVRDLMMCVYIYIYIHIHTYMYIYIYIYITFVTASGTLSVQRLAAVHSLVLDTKTIDSAIK